MVTFNKDVDYNVSTLQSALVGHFGAYDPENQLAVAKIFTTIQGEMPFAGFPAVFLRLAGCNRGGKIEACYFCDSYFSIDDETKLYDATKLASELEEMVKEYGSQGIMLVITGGEPMLQAPALAKFIEIMDDADVFNFIQLETNGDLFKTKPATALLEKISELNDEYFEDGEDYPDLMPISVVISPKRTVKHIEKCAFSKYASEPGFFVRILVSADENSQYYIIPEFMIEEWEMIHFFISPITEYKRKPDDHEIVNIADDIDIDATRLNISRAIYLANMFGCRVSLQAHSYIGIP